MAVNARLIHLAAQSGHPVPEVVCMGIELQDGCLNRIGSKDMNVHGERTGLAWRRWLVRGMCMRIDR